MINGSVLDGLKVLAWQPPHGKRLIWMDELGEINKSKIAGFFLVNTEDVVSRSQAIASRAALTNSSDFIRALKTWPDLDMPEALWLGGRQRRNILNDSDDVGLPEWAWGYEIVEIEEPLGHFAALDLPRRDSAILRHLSGSRFLLCALANASTTHGSFVPSLCS